MEAYKVVTFSENKLLSINSIIKLEYNKGVKTIPEIGKLFVFKEKEHALDFMGGTEYARVCTNRQLWLCEVPNLTECKRVSPVIGPKMSRLSIESLTRFWSDTELITCKAPIGTFTTDWVILKERVFYESGSSKSNS